MKCGNCGHNCHGNGVKINKRNKYCINRFRVTWYKENEEVEYGWVFKKETENSWEYRTEQVLVKTNEIDHYHPTYIPGGGSGTYKNRHTFTYSGPGSTKWDTVYKEELQNKQVKYKTRVTPYYYLRDIDDIYYCGCTQCTCSRCLDDDREECRTTSTLPLKYQKCQCGCYAPRNNSVYILDKCDHSICDECFKKNICYCGYIFNNNDIDDRQYCTYGNENAFYTILKLDSEIDDQYFVGREHIKLYYDRYFGIEEIVQPKCCIIL